MIQLQQSVWEVYGGFLPVEHRGEQRASTRIPSVC
jgi:hypothetical protein